MDDEREALLDALEPVLDAVAAVHGSIDSAADLDGPLQVVLERILEATGFGAGALSTVLAGGTLRVVVVAGPDELRTQLLGVVIPRSELDAHLAAAEHWGRLRFVPASTSWSLDAAYSWVPDIPVPVEPDGWHPEDALLAPLHAASGRLIGVLSLDLPVSGRRPDRFRVRLLELLAGQAELALRNARRGQQLRATEESFRLAFESTAVGTGLVALAPGGPLRLLSANRALERIAGVAGLDTARVLDDLLGTTGEDWAQVLLAAPAAVLRVERQLPARPGAGDGPAERPWVQLTATALPMHSIEEGRAVVQVEDITERRSARRTDEPRSPRDPLAGPADRAELHERIAAAVAAARAGRPPEAVVCCDLDDFRSVNDLFGHLAGDVVLRTCAARLDAEVGGRGRVFRTGGDEFAVVLPAADVAAVTDGIRRRIAEPIEHGGRHLRVGTSIGHCVVDGVTASPEDLVATADAAMYRDKRRRARLSGAGLRSPADTAG